MNTTYRAGWLLAAWLFAATGITAQTSIQDIISRADKQFDLYAYNLALRTYEQALAEQPNNAHALARMGDCYFQLNKPQDALSWYDRAVVRNDVEPETMLRYGKALMQTGDYVGAKKWFVLYSEGNPIVGQHFAQMCDFALLAGKKEGLFQALNEPLNTEAADYGPAFYNTQIVYNSARTDIKRKTAAKTSSDWTGSAYNQLYRTQRNPGDNYLQAPAFLHGDLEHNFNEGPVSFSGDGRRVAFCRNNFIDGTRQIAERGMSMSLYFAEVVDGRWINEKPFPYNGSNFATGFPCLAPDGNTLYFASNQEGGLGGWDIYVASWNGSTWTVPRNLGAPVNTSGNEVTPFFDGANLYFSSDWHKGLGGMDVFRAEIQDNAIKNVYHLGAGINSSRDDYGFIFDPQSNTGYLTSTRPGGRGNEDIWQIRKKVDEFTIAVTDVQRNPVSGAEIDFSACNAGIKQTDNTGHYSFAVAAGKADCRVTVRKTGYRPTVLPIQSSGDKNLEAVLIPEYGTAGTSPVTSTPNAPLTLQPVYPSATPTTLPDLESNTAPLTYSTTTYPVKNGAIDKYTVYVMDDQGRALPDAELNLTTCGLGSIYTDAAGKGSFYFPSGASCNLIIRKSGLEDIVIPVNAQTRKEMSVAMSADQRTKFSGVVLDAATRKTIQGVIVTAKSRQLAHETLASSNASGQYTLLLRPFQVYDITYTKDGYLNYTSALQTERALKADMELSPITLEPSRSSLAADATAPVTYSTAPATSGGMISLADLEQISTTSTPATVAVQPATVSGSVVKSPAVSASKANGYSIQLSANPEPFTGSKIKKYDDYAQYGNLYTVKEGKMNKLRLGVYSTREDANAVLKTISGTAKDAFVVWETQADANLAARKTDEMSASDNSAFLAAKGLVSTPSTQQPLNTAPSTIRFAVQVASWPNDRTVLVSDYSKLGNLGHIYIQPENDRMRVRVGTWEAYEKAEAAQAEAVRLGYKDAIVVTEKVENITNDRLRTATAAAAPQNLSTAPVQYSSTSAVAPVTYSSAAKMVVANPNAAKYYIRVCALEDSSNFDAKKLDGSGGVIEKWPIGDTKMTAIMLTGLPTVEQAIATTDKLRAKGFTDAYIIKDENGRMSKYRY